MQENEVQESAAQSSPANDNEVIEKDAKSLWLCAAFLGGLGIDQYQIDRYLRGILPPMLFFLPFAILMVLSPTYVLDHVDKMTGFYFFAAAHVLSVIVWSFNVWTFALGKATHKTYSFRYKGSKALIAATILWQIVIVVLLSADVIMLDFLFEFAGYRG